MFFMCETHQQPKPNSLYVSQCTYVYTYYIKNFRVGAFRTLLTLTRVEGLPQSIQLASALKRHVGFNARAYNLKERQRESERHLTREDTVSLL